MPQRILRTEPGHREYMERMSTGSERWAGDAQSQSIYSHAPFESEESFSEGFGEDVGQVPEQTLPIPASFPLQALLERFKGSSNWLKVGLIGLAIVGLYIGLDESRKKKFFS